MVGELQASLGRNLRRLRRERNLSQEELADFLRIHRTYVGGLERGERNPSLQVVERLAERLGVPSLELLAGPDESSAVVLRAAGAGSGEPPDARSVRRARRPEPEPDLE